VHAGHGHGVRRVDPQRQSTSLDRRHSRILRAAARRAERLQDPLGGAPPYPTPPHLISPHLTSPRLVSHDPTQPADGGQPAKPDGGISVYIPPKINLPYKFLYGYWLFFLFDPGQIRYRASVRLSCVSFTYLHTTIYTPQMKFLATPLLPAGRQIAIYYILHSARYLVDEIHPCSGRSGSLIIDHSSEVSEPQVGGSKFALSQYFGYWLLQ